MRRIIHFLVAATGCYALPLFAADQVGLVRIQGAIGPSTASYIERAIGVSASRNDACLIIQLDTPGGLVDSTRDIVEAFYSSRIPVVVFVGPSPARATSAGTFITIAANIAAMAPHTTIGAAHPVSLSGGMDTNSVMATKVENDVASFVRTIAEKRGRNVDWAESAVRESVSITAEQALELDVIDLIAEDVPDLLNKINGREIDGNVLRTSGAQVSEIPMIPRERLFQLLWRPEVMFVLMLVAIYGIIGEISNPGAILPGVLGVIALVLVLYMSAILPVNIAGLALIGLALLLFILDIFTPTHGLLTFGGIIAFFLGALMLFNRSAPEFRLSLVYIIPGTVLTAAFFLFVVGAGLRAQRLPVRAGSETMLGKVIPALTPIDSRSGKVFVEGEYWNAISDTPVEAGTPVEIVDRHGLTLKVKPKP